MHTAKRLLASAAISTAAELNELITVINEADREYYIHDEPVLADEEYDRLFALLKATEAAHPEWLRPDSPTQRVAQGISDQWHTVQHLKPMLSLDNSYNAEDLRSWDQRVRSGLGLDKVQYCLEPKYDGAGISLVYRQDHLAIGATRGDGIAGEDITPNAKQLNTIPLSAALQQYGVATIEIRGEVVIKKATFEKLNEARTAEGLAPLANPRNAASGALRMLDSKSVRGRGLFAILYHISTYDLVQGASTPTPLLQHSTGLQWLSSLGFSTPRAQLHICQDIEEVIAQVAEYEQKRDSMPFEIDGMVVKVDSLAQQQALGSTAHHPRWAMAYKFAARQATTTLDAVEFQVGRTGSITPVAKVAPVHVGGVTIQSVSLFNEAVIAEKDLRIGDTVLLERAGDVIPYIVKPIIQNRSGNELPIVFPTRCPVCHDALYRPEGEAAWRCVNANCAAQVVERLAHFVSKDAMDIRSLGTANVQRFFDLGILTRIQDIYTLDYSRLEGLDKIGQKSIDNLRKAIENSKSQPLHRLIFGLGIRYVGEVTAKTMAAAVEDVRDLKDWPQDKLEALADVGPKVAVSVVEFFANADNLALLQSLADNGVTMTNAAASQQIDDKLAGKTFLFTGTLTQFKRSDAEELVTARGGKILSGVTKGLNYLVVGADAGSKLAKAQKLGSVEILSEAEYLSLVAT